MSIITLSHFKFPSDVLVSQKISTHLKTLNSFTSTTQFRGKKRCGEMLMNAENTVLKTLVGKQVKALYYDEGKSKKVVGTLNEANDRYLIINDVVVGLGINFIACIPIKEQQFNS